MRQKDELSQRGREKLFYSLQLTQLRFWYGHSVVLQTVTDYKTARC